MDYRHVMETDPELFKAIADEVSRQREHIELIASENFVSPAVMEAMGSPLTNKYAEGYPDKRYYGGCQYVDVAENLARDRAKLLFGAEHANVQPHSGAQANTAVYFAMLNPGDTVLGMNLSHGGHLTHGSPVNISGKYFNFIAYGVDEATGYIDYDAVRALAMEKKPRMIVAGASAYPRAIDFARLREIADEAGAMLMVDMAHIAGLVAAGMHQSPVPYADFVTTTTHKTLRGPRGGLILCREQYAKAIDKAIFPGTQGGPLMHVIAARGLCVIFNPSPVNDALADYPLESVSWFLLNEIEGEALTGESEPQAILARMKEKYPSASVVLTLGAEGAYCMHEGQTLYQPAFRVKAVDTTAAGDTFTGYFVSGLAQGMPMERIMKRAARASSIAVGRMGAADSIPLAAEVDAAEA